MPLAETNGNYKCDECGKPMPHGTKSWLDLDEGKIFCLSCRTQDGKIVEKEPKPVEPKNKTVVVRHESSKVEELKKEVSRLKAENKQLRKDLQALRGHAKSLLGLTKKMREERHPSKIPQTDPRCTRNRDNTRRRPSSP